MGTSIYDLLSRRERARLREVGMMPPVDVVAHYAAFCAPFVTRGLSGRVA